MQTGRAKVWETSLKIGMVIVWKCFPPAKHNELLGKEKGWLTDVGHNSWWHLKRANHAAHKPKFEKMGLFGHPQWCYFKIWFEVTAIGYFVEGRSCYTHSGQVTPFSVITLINVDLSSVRSNDILRKALSQETLQPPTNRISLKSLI